MHRTLTPRSTLENLKREAKRWLTALRENDPDARARLGRAHPNAPATPTLRDVQHALAREHGLSGWTALASQLAGATRADIDQAERVAWFIQNACPDHTVRGGPAHVMARHTAERMLVRHAELARDSIYTAVVCGDVEAVEHMLAERPHAASESGGPKGWAPLLYLCFTRLPLAAASDNAVAIARALLDRGADPNAYFMAGDSHYTPLVGAIGEGEEDRPAHPQRDALVRLLLDRGAEPYDIQVVYNIHFHGDVLWFLKLIHERALALGRHADWDDPRWSMLDMGGYGSGARWHLEIALKKDDLELAEWVLAHGASPDAEPARDPRFPRGTLYEEAIRRGFTGMADLLVRYGASPSAPKTLDGLDAFVDACMRLDQERARALLREHPEYLRAPAAMHAASRHDLVDVVAFLLELGMSPDIADPEGGGQRPLHVAAYHDSPHVTALLIERGAAVDVRDSKYGATPLGFAVYAQHPRTIDVVGRFSRDVWNLAFAGNVERLRDVLSVEPGFAKAAHPDGETPLMCLPDDEGRAIEIVELFLAHGADPTLRNEQGLTAADIAGRRALYEVAELLRAEG